MKYCAVNKQRLCTLMLAVVESFLGLKRTFPEMLWGANSSVQLFAARVWGM